MAAGLRAGVLAGQVRVLAGPEPGAPDGAAVPERLVRASSSSSSSSPSRSASPAVLGIAAVQKSRQLGILKAMGVDDRGAARIFLIQGLVLGVGGSILGIGLGYGIGLAFLRFFGHRGLRAGDRRLQPRRPGRPGRGRRRPWPRSSRPGKASRLSPIEVIRNG
ncbi:MAG: hypothetical protein M0C28_37820 [Candidatus Moduliflexus flocculans]|nr:hypothetical protein [Candidatus Moduliflexus flocculans]